MFINQTPSAAEWASLDKSDHSSRATSILLVNGICLGLTLLVMLLRMFTKIFMTAKLFIDDYFMTGSAVFFTAVCIINMHAVHLGLGKHVWDLSGISDNSTLDEITKAAAPVEMMNYTALIVIVPAIVLAKLSIVTVLIRIFPQSMRALRFFLIALAVILTGCCVSQALLVMFQCSPIQASWNIEAGVCYIEPLQAVAIGLGALNVVTDVVICVTPIPYFWRLNIPKPQKLCLCAVFLVGLFACAISIVRVLSLRGINDNLDVTYVVVPYFDWSIVEAGLIIITGSVPFLRPLMATILPEFFKSCNFTSLLSSGKAKENSDEFWLVPSSAGTQGDITITKEFRLEETDMPHVDSRTQGKPLTAVGPRMGSRMVVVCEKYDA